MAADRKTRTAPTRSTRRPATSTAAKKRARTRVPGKSAAKATGKAKAPARIPDDVQLAITAALDKKAEHLQLLDLRKGGAFTDFFLICNGTNIRQVQAIADGIEETLKKTGTRPALVEGYQKGDWVLLDYFDFIVHVFTPSTREFYALDRLWGDAERIEIPA
jgi:ribosome-associated protein